MVDKDEEIFQPSRKMLSSDAVGVVAQKYGVYFNPSERCRCCDVEIMGIVAQK